MGDVLDPIPNFKTIVTLPIEEDGASRIYGVVDSGTGARNHASVH
jgi:hypothetical protein